MGAEDVGDQRPPPSPPADPLDPPEPEPLLPPELASAPPELEPPEPLDPLDPLALPELVTPEVEPTPLEVEPLPVPELPGPCDPPGPPSLVFVSSGEPGSVPPPLPEQPNGAARAARYARRTARTRGWSAIMERRAASDVPCSGKRGSATICRTFCGAAAARARPS